MFTTQSSSCLHSHSMALNNVGPASVLQVQSLLDADLGLLAQSSRHSRIVNFILFQIFIYSGRINWEQALFFNDVLITKHAQITKKKNSQVHKFQLKWLNGYQRRLHVTYCSDWFDISKMPGSNAPDWNGSSGMGDQKNLALWTTCEIFLSCEVKCLINVKEKKLKLGYLLWNVG